MVGLDGDVTYEDLKSFPYLEQVFKETLRFFTVVPFLVRGLTEDYELGMSVLIFVLCIHLCIIIH